MNWGDARLPEAFWAKCTPEPNSGCWLWYGAQSHGYGVVRLNGRNHPAHRVALAARDGDNGHEDTDHLCRTECCVNPEHLEAVSHAENMRRSPKGFQNRETQRMLSMRSSATCSLERCPCGREWSGLTTNNEGERKRKVCAHCRLQRQRARTAKKRGVPFVTPH